MVFFFMFRRCTKERETNRDKKNRAKFQSQCASNTEDSANIPKRRWFGVHAQRNHSRTGGDRRLPQNS